MKLIRKLDDLKEFANNKKIGVTIGNFDGVHLGHQSLLKNFISQCRVRELVPVVYTFEPHPILHIKDDVDSYLLTSYEEKYFYLHKEGIETIYIVEFDAIQRKRTAQSFLREEIFSINQLELLFLGYDFRLGANKSGGYELAKKVGFEYGVEVIQDKEIMIENEVVSSSLVRRELTAGNVKKANKFLGKDFFITGVVKDGKKIGRTIGFPTANIEIEEDKFLPKPGVYSGTCEIEGSIFKVASNIGYRPTVSSGRECKVEAHLLGYSGDLYGKKITINLQQFIREETKFENLEKLKKQISLDLEVIKKS